MKSLLNKKVMAVIYITSFVLLMAVVVALVFPSFLDVRDRANLHEKDSEYAITYKYDELDVNVKSPQAFVYDVSNDTIIFTKGEDKVVYPGSTTKLLTALYALTVLPENADKKTITWKSSSVKIATIRRGIVKGVAEGTAVITATADGYSVTCMVTVKPKLPDAIDQVEHEEEALEVYDIVGRPLKLQVKSVEELDPGIYIINGRKTVVK